MTDAPEAPVAADTSAVSEAPAAPPAPAPEAPAFEPTPRASIERAMAAVDADEGGSGQEQAAPKQEATPKAPAKAEATGTPKAETPDGPQRGPDGKFVAKDTAPATPPAEGADKPQEAAQAEQPKTDATQFAEPPSRFSADAKEAWKDAPEAVKAEAHRAIREMETGLQEHQLFREPLKPFEEMAAKHNTDIPTALDNYTKLDAELAKDPINGLDLVAQQYGLSLRQVAEHVLGRTPDQSAAQQDAEKRAMRQEIDALKQQIGGVSKTFEQQKAEAVTRQIEDFKAANPRFDELEADMTELLRTGYAKDLPDAYAKAERLNPALAEQPAPEPVAAPAAPTPDLTAQTRKASLSVTGAPSPGSNPTTRKPPSSAREALERAAAQTGI